MITVIKNDLALEDTSEPVLKHRYKSWMRDCYHRRIQKKWIKRHGYVKKPCWFYLEDSSTIICHPSLYREIARQMAPETDHEIRNKLFGYPYS